MCAASYKWWLDRGEQDRVDQAFRTKSLQFNFKRLATIPKKYIKDLWNCTSLTTLHLVGNDLQYIPDAVRDLSLLEVLNVGRYDRLRCGALR